MSDFAKPSVLVLVASTLICVADARAETIRAASCSHEDARKAVDAASDGDTVVVPAGTATWTTSDRSFPAVLISRKGSGKEITAPFSAATPLRQTGRSRLGPRLLRA